MVTAQLRELDIQYGKEYVRGLRAAHDLERRRSPSGVDIIDFRMAPNTPDYTFAKNPFHTRRDVQDYFQRLAGDVHRDSPDGVYLGEQAESKAAYMQFLQNPRVGMNNFADYLKKIAGYNPRLIPWTEVQTVKGALARQFTDLNDLPFDRGGWETYFKMNGLSATEATKQVKSLGEVVVPEIVRAVGVRSQPRINLKVVSLPEYWIGWVTADRQSGSEYRFNTHPVNRERLFPGVPVRIRIHEDDHGVQAQSYADNIDDGFVNPGRGDTTVPGLEQPLLEAVASRIVRLHPHVLDFLSAEKRAEVEFAVDLQYLTDIVYTNAQYSLLILRSPRERVTKELLELLPHEPKDRIELMLDQMTKRPERMFYLGGYGEGSYFIKDEVEGMTEEKRLEFSKQAHFQPMTLHQARDLVRELRKP